MKNLILSLVLLFSAVFAFGQDSFKSISIQASAGVVPMYLVDGGSTQFLPTTLAISYRLNSRIAVSGFAAYGAYTSRPMTFSGNTLVEGRNRTVTTGVRFEAHSNPLNVVDFYGGLVLGVSMPQVEYVRVSGDAIGETVIIGESNGPHQLNPVSNKIIAGGFVGAAYQVNNRIGVFGELGYATAILNLGVSVKL